MDLRNVFIDNLRNYRKNKGFSQMSLASACNTSASYIGEIEIGRKFPSVEMIQKLCEALDIKPYMLFMEKEDKYFLSLNPEIKKDMISKIQNSIKEIIESQI